MERYGVPNGGAAAEAQAKAKARYTYKGRVFDSAPELAFKIWLDDNGIRHVYRAGEYLPYEYEYGGKTYCARYYYDFRLEDGRIIEIKGGQFIDGDGNLINPYALKQLKNGEMTADRYGKISA